jgi:nucleotide-binding universal stress UspA family protein
MERSKKNILVPTDFSKVADYALQHAVRVSEVVGEAITLLHVVSSKTEVEEVGERINKVVAQIEQKYSIKPNAIVAIGDIPAEIARVSEEISASLVIMGSESVKGKDNLSGLRTLDVITKAKVPFVTIQEPPINRRYDDIVFPIDFTVENKEKHGWISYFCDFYVSKFHLIKPNVSDPELVAKVDLNMASAVRYLDERGAKYTVYTVPGAKAYQEEVLDLAVNIRADLIVVMTTKMNDDSNYKLEPHEEYIIGNAGHIPVMSINPR